MAVKKSLKIGKMEGAPDWYGTPFDKLHFEWTREEKVELDRYCEKILKNASEEEMTPKDRYYATAQGKPKDRLHIDPLFMVPAMTRTLDHWTDAVKPGDVYKRPKLHVKCQLATAARYKLDAIDFYTIVYGENFFGADAKMMDYGTPMVIGKPPLKTLEDIESVELPDPWKHSLYPGYLWAVREVQNILKQYGADKVMPVEVSYCGGPMGTAFMGNMMMSMPDFMKAVVKQPEVAKAAIKLASEWSIKFGKACKSLKPDGLYLCDVTGTTPVSTSAWLMDYYHMIGKEVKGGDDLPYMWHETGSPGWLPWMPLFVEKGAVGPKNFDGWWIGPDMPAEQVYKYSREHNIYCCITISDIKMIEGDWSIEDDIKVRSAIGKQHPRHGLGIGVVDYWTPPAHIDKCLAWEKKYGKF